LDATPNARQPSAHVQARAHAPTISAYALVGRGLKGQAGGEEGVFS
jgi:hypothetical protein